MRRGWRDSGSAPVGVHLKGSGGHRIDGVPQCSRTRFEATCDAGPHEVRQPGSLLAELGYCRVLTRSRGAPFDLLVALSSGAGAQYVSDCDSDGDA